MPQLTTHVIFDLDGILLDTEPMYTRATQLVLDVYGKTYGWDLKGRMIGRSSLESAAYLVRALELPLSAEQYLAKRRPLLEQLFPSVEALPGARELVEALTQRSVPLGLATSSERALYQLKTRHHAWFAAFQAVVCGDDQRIRALKPSPEIFLMAAADLGVRPECCLVFEDSPAGVEAALAAGMRVIALPDPHMSATAYPGAERIVRSYSELDIAALNIHTHTDTSAPIL